MDSGQAYIYGLLHDIGRIKGKMQARHSIEGYYYMMKLGYEDIARICLTHTFQYQNIEGIYDEWDCSEEEKAFVERYLGSITYDDYDKLIQLCDALSLDTGYCYAEKKMISSIINFGVKETTTKKCKAILDLKRYFDAQVEGDIYLLFDK